MTNIEVLTSIITAFIVSAVGPTMVEWVKAKLKKEHLVVDVVKEELIKSCPIQEEIETILNTVHADRVWIAQFHNGGKFLHSSKSVQKFSVFHEVTEIGIAPIAHTFNNIPVSIYSRAFEELLKNGSIFINDYKDVTVATYGLKGGAEAVGTKSCYIFALFNLGTDEFMGVMGVDWVTKPKSLKGDQLQYLTTEANRLAGYISKFIEN